MYLYFLETLFNIVWREECHKERPVKDWWQLPGGEMWKIFVLSCFLEISPATSQPNLSLVSPAILYARGRVWFEEPSFIKGRNSQVWRRDIF